MRRVIGVVRQRFPLVKLESNPAEFSLSLNGFSISLENLYRSAAGAGDSADAMVERWVLELLRLAEGSPDQRATLDELRPRIMPMVIVHGPRDGASSIVAQQLLEGLMVAYAIDSERTISYIPQKVFEKWKISVEDLHETAINNLVERSESLPAHAAQDESGRVAFVIIQTMDGYDASRILLPTLHEKLREHLGSPFLAGIPNRDILICFRDDPETIRKMSRQIAHDYRTMPHQISDRLFLITADGIAEYESSGA